jgi:hypothetical protein
MKILSVFLVTLMLVAQTPAQASLDKVKSTVDKARSYLGDTNKLNSVKTIQFHGKITLFQESEREGEVILSFRKPYSEKIEFIFPEQTMVTGFNGYEGYEYIQGKLKNGEPFQNIRSIGGDDLRRNKAAALENLSFFRPFTFDEENIKDYGIVEVDGKSAHKIDFIHYGRYVFSRYFDVATGDLLKSELDTGVVTIETGEMMVDGIRFSSKITGLIEGETKYEMVFDKIVINPEIDPAFFDYPDK